MSRCPSCKTTVHFDRRRGTMVEPSDPYTVHHCEVIAEYVRECTCGFVVFIQPDDTRLLWPSRQPHRRHAFTRRSTVVLAGQADRVELWYDEEYRRAGLSRPEPREPMLAGPNPPPTDPPIAREDDGTTATPPPTTERKSALSWPSATHPDAVATKIQDKASTTRNPSSNASEKPTSSSGPRSGSGASSLTFANPEKNSMPSSPSSPKNPEVGDSFIDHD